MSELQQRIEAFQPAPETWTGVRTAEEARPVLPSEDWRIVQRALRGDSDALSSLFDRDAGRLYRSAHSLLRNKEDAEDALQDGLLNAYINLGSFGGRSQFTTWLMRIVMNAALMNRRRLRAGPSVPLDELPAEVIPLASALTGPSPNPVELFARSETRNAVLDAINQLSPPLRSAFRLRHIQGLSTREAARAEGIKINVLKSRLWRARKQLASLLNERGMTLANCSFPSRFSALSHQVGPISLQSERRNLRQKDFRSTPKEVL